MSSTWTDGSIDADGVEIHYVRTGRAAASSAGTLPAVVLMHGFTDNARCWTRVASAIEASADVVMIDSRNHGLSSAAVGTSADMADDVALLMTQLDLGAGAVIGHSLGANAAAELAVRHPALVGRLVLEDPPWRPLRARAHGGDSNQAKATAARRAALSAFIDSFAGLSRDEILEQGRSDHPSWHEVDLDAWATSKQQVRAQAIESITAHHWNDLVPQLECPTLLIHGQTELGGVIGPEVAAVVRSRSELVSVAPIQGAGHNVRREAFEQYMGHLRAFLTLPDLEE